MRSKCNLVILMVGDKQNWMVDPSVIGDCHFTLECLSIMVSSKFDDRM